MAKRLTLLGLRFTIPTPAVPTQLPEHRVMGALGQVNCRCPAANADVVWLSGSPSMVADPDVRYAIPVGGNEILWVPDLSYIWVLGIADDVIDFLFMTEEKGD